MKNKHSHSSLAKGFTLVEILVVIAIIAILVSISTPVCLKAMSRADETNAKSMMTELITASQLFESDHGSITAGYVLNQPRNTTDPDAGGYTMTQTTPLTASGDAGGTGNANQFLTQLTNTVGNISGTDAINRRGIVYLKMKEATEGQGFRSGLIYSGPNPATSAAIGMADPWGRRFFIGVNYDRNAFYNNMSSPYGDDITTGTSVVIMSSGGKDGVFDTANDVKSWE